MQTHSTNQDCIQAETYNFDTEMEMKYASALFELLEHLSFPFLASLSVKSEGDKTICVEYENFQENTVEQFIKKQIQSNEAIDEQKLLDYSSQGAMTLAFIHKHKLVHGQISPQNLSIAENGTPRFGFVDFRVNLQFQDVKEINEQNLKNLESEDMHNFGKVLYSLSELKEFSDNNDEIQQSNKSALSDPNVELRLNANQLLEQVEIQERINIWKQQQPNSQSPIEIAKSQFSNYRLYLAQLLVEITGASVQDRLAIAERGEFVELVNILKWARNQNKELSRPIQELVCEVVQDLINENKSAAAIGLEQSEIVQQLKQLLGTNLEIEEV
ncbi:MAG: hypothetical protein EZS28_045532, partial [Streblomastix strix]